MSRSVSSGLFAVQPIELRDAHRILAIHAVAVYLDPMEMHHGRVDSAFLQRVETEETAGFCQLVVVGGGGEHGRFIDFAAQVFDHGVWPRGCITSRRGIAEERLGLGGLPIAVRGKIAQKNMVSREILSGAIAVERAAGLAVTSRIKS